MNKIQKFIDDNKLDFSSEGSGLNSNCTVISGYALHMGVETFEQLAKSMPELTAGAFYELERVFDYAKDADYGYYWTSEDAQRRWIF